MTAIKKENLKLRRSFVLALLVLLIAFAVATAATFAWYIYTLNAHTTNVHMVAGSSVTLQISDNYNGPFGSAAVLEEFTGTLNPVSTDRIQGGFQKVAGFTNGSENQPMLIANLFEASDATDYFQTTLYFRTNGGDTKVYLSDIGFEDASADNPTSTAIRIGFVDTSNGEEHIFSITDAKNPQKQYNTITGQEGYVLDCTRTDGTTVPFTPLSSENFCVFDSDTGITDLKTDSVPLMTVSGSNGDFGEPVALDIYIWLEGCDEDCTGNLAGTTLSNIALGFAGIAG